MLVNTHGVCCTLYPYALLQKLASVLGHICDWVIPHRDLLPRRAVHVCPAISWTFFFVCQAHRVVYSRVCCVECLFAFVWTSHLTPEHFQHVGGGIPDYYRHSYSEPGICLEFLKLIGFSPPFARQLSSNLEYTHVALSAGDWKKNRTWLDTIHYGSPLV